jgi:hypothetical protein
MAQIPGIQCAHAKHRQQDRGQQNEGLGMGKAEAHGQFLLGPAIVETL